MSFNRGTGKEMWYTYTTEYYSAIKKNKIMPSAATWMDAEIVILSEASQTEQHKYRMISLRCALLKSGMEHRVEPPVQYSNFPLAIYFTCDNVYVSMLLSPSPAVSKVCRLCLHLYSCPARRLISTTFLDSTMTT